MRILKDFKAEASWVLEPGDMLYVPPHIGHSGEALDTGQTLSIGFLAPRESDLVTAFVLEATEQLDYELRYADRDMQVSCFLVNILLYDRLNI